MSSTTVTGTITSGNITVTIPTPAAGATGPAGPAGTSPTAASIAATLAATPSFITAVATALKGSTTTTPTVTPSANNTVIKLGSTAAITDASGNKWTIGSNGVIAVNGTPDTTTANVTQIAYVNGVVWQENTSNLWWSKTSPSAGWLPSGGTSTSPLPTTTTTPPVTTPPVVTPPATTGTFGIAVSGNKLINTQTGATVQLRGCDVSGLESVAIQGWSPADPWGGQTPIWTNITTGWKLNAVRIPLNSASWLGLTTYDYSGATRKADPGSNYQATVLAKVQAATAAGLFVIIDLHWNAPKLLVTGQTVPQPFSPMGQAPLADADYSITFWTQVATMFKGFPNVIFDLFNEPYPDSYGTPSGVSPWSLLRDGGTLNKFPNNTSNGANFEMDQNWTAAGMQAMLNAVRATGATNVVMTAGLAYASDQSQWVAYAPVDPLKQLACSVHFYPAYGATFGTPTYNTLNATTCANILAVKAAGYPIIIGETGGHDVAGTPNDVFIQNILAFADANGLSILGWTWNVWGNTDNVLIKDTSGTPTDGYGVVFKNWSTTHA